MDLKLGLFKSEMFYQNDIRSPLNKCQSKRSFSDSGESSKLVPLSLEKRRGKNQCPTAVNYSVNHSPVTAAQIEC